jgi:TolB-like protein/DNA-binding winged helix-turn-helix (wHTH) protein/Flp pilus assembly protein TadD
MVTIHALGPFRLDTQDDLLFRGAEPVTLGRRAIALLRALVERPGAVVSKDALIEAAWSGQEVEESNLTVQIAALRRVLAKTPGGERWIETMPRRGYRFVGPAVTQDEYGVTAAPPQVAAAREQHGDAERSEITGMSCELVGTAGRADGMDLEDSRRASRQLSLRRFLIAASFLALIGTACTAWFVSPNRNSPTVSLQATAAASLKSPPAVASAPASRLSIVVLPFTNLSNDPEQEYFADGITDDLTTDLSQISGSFVIARNTAFTYKGKSVDAKQIGRELGVRYVLEGSVQRTGDRVQVNAQLIDAETGAHVWADRFDIDRANLPKAQSEITGRLAQTLHLGLVETAARRIEQERPTDADASDLTMRGWARFYRPRSESTLEEAQRLFERSLEIDPRSVDARIGLALVLVSSVGDGWSNSAQQDQARAEQLLLEALERDPNRSTAHYALGRLRRFQNRLPESQIELETAVALDRNDQRAFLQLGTTLLFMGQPEAAIPQFEKSIQLSPHDPSIYGSYNSLGICYFFLGRLDEAIDLLMKARAANPRLYYVHLYLAGALGFRGDLDEARAVLAEGIKLKPQVNSLAAWRAYRPWLTNPSYWTLLEETFNVGLRRAGFPEE